MTYENMQAKESKIFQKWKITRDTHREHYTNTKSETILYHPKATEDKQINKQTNQI